MRTCSITAMTYSARVVWARLRKREDARGAGMRVPYQVLVERWGISRNTLRAAIRALEAHGFIAVDRRTRPPGIRLLLADKSGPTADEDAGA